MDRLRLATFAACTGLILFAAGCGSEASSSHASTAAADEAGVVERIDGVAVVHLTGNDQMRFNIDEFSVRSGEKVRLTLEHVGKLPAAAMGHNVVILNRLENVQRFGAQIFQEGASPDNDYLPPSMMDRVFAHTDLVGGGETTTVEFVAPAPGEYPFLCTFPGHFGTMKGRMIVQ